MMTRVDVTDTICRELLLRLRVLLPPLLSAQRASWEQGVAAHALLESHQFWERVKFPVPHPIDFIPFIYAFAHESVVRQAPDGRLSVLLNGDGTSDPGAADPASMGEVIYWLLAEEDQIARASTRNFEGKAMFLGQKNTMSSVLAEAVEKQYRYIVADCPRGSTGLLSHRIDCKEIWSDTLYMTPPFLIAAALSRLRYDPGDCTSTGDALRYGLRQIVLAAEVLQTPSGEWSHIYDLDAAQFKRKARWGVGNGWVCCGIVRVLGMLIRPAETTHASVEELAQIIMGDAVLGSLVRQCACILLSSLRACLTHMRPDGLFHDVVDDPTTFVETNLSQMLAYTIFRLALLRRIPSLLAPHMPEVRDEEVDAWLEQAETMWAAAVGKTDEWGYVRDVCGSPQFDNAGTAAEGQAWAVMMEIARAEWCLQEAQDNGEVNS